MKKRSHSFYIVFNDLIYEVSFAKCTQVGEEKWYTQKILDFNLFHDEGRNKNGKVIIAIEKHLKVSEFEINQLKTLVLDIIDFNEFLRVIIVHWSDSQKREIDDIILFSTNNMER